MTPPEQPTTAVAQMHALAEDLMEEGTVAWVVAAPKKDSADDDDPVDWAISRGHPDEVRDLVAEILKSMDQAGE